MDSDWREVLEAERSSSGATVTFLDTILSNASFTNTVFMADSEFLQECFRVCFKLVKKGISDRWSERCIEINSIKILCLEGYTNVSIKNNQSFFPQVLNECSERVTTLPKMEYFLEVDMDSEEFELVKSFWDKLDPETWKYDEKLLEHLISNVKVMIEYCVLVQQLSHNIQVKIKSVLGKDGKDMQETSAFGNFITFIQFLHTLVCAHFLQRKNVRIVKKSDTGVTSGNCSEIQLYFELYYADTYDDPQSAFLTATGP